MQDKEKDSYIRIRIDKDTKDKFQQLCKTKAINSSELIRQLIVNWCMDQETNRPHRRQTDLDNL